VNKFRTAEKGFGIGRREEEWAFFIKAFLTSLKKRNKTNTMERKKKLHYSTHGHWKSLHKTVF